MSTRIHLSSPDVTQLEEDALVRAFRSGWIAPLGPEVDAFEEELAEYCGRDHAVALSSGTAALHLGLLTLGVGPGDTVLTSTLTFAATANAITYTGAEPVFVDADLTGNMNADLLKQAFETLDREGKRVRAVVPVDLLGKVVNHEAIHKIASHYGAVVLADAAESLGAKRDGQSAGSFGLAAAISFNGNKVITTSGGGALLTDDHSMAEHVRYLATQARKPVVHYEHADVGYNYRLSNILAGLGRAQLTRLDAMIERRQALRLRYIERFRAVPGVSVFGEPSDPRNRATRDNFWLTCVLIDSTRAGFTPDQLREHLSRANIETRPIWKPMHIQPVYQKHRAFIDGTSEDLFKRGLSLPSGSALDRSQIKRVEYELLTFLEANHAQ